MMSDAIPQDILGATVSLVLQRQFVLNTVNNLLMKIITTAATITHIQHLQARRLCSSSRSDSTLSLEKLWSAMCDDFSTV
jgi:hypothetical protein